MIVGVTGGRDLGDKDRAWVYKKLDRYHKKYGFTHLVHGGARGLDTLADQWCETQPGVQPVCCRAMWNRDGNKAAGPIRNRAMRPLIERLLSFPGGNGTKDMTDHCAHKGVPITRIKEP